MARSSTRVGLATLLGQLTDLEGAPLFTAVYDRKPKRVPPSLFPACYVMIPEAENVRTGMRQKHDRFGCQLRVVDAGVPVDWPSSPAEGNVYFAPDTDPQVVFDGLIDQLVDGLVANQAFTQDQPDASRQVIQLGQKITTRTLEPQRDGETILFGAIVEFEVSEQILGV